MDTLLIFFLIRSFLNIVEKNQEPVFLNQRVPPISVYNLKWRAKFQIYRLLIRDSDWQNCKHFSEYKYKIRLVSILRKREDHPLISISTIQFSALFSYYSPPTPLPVHVILYSSFFFLNELKHNFNQNSDQIFAKSSRSCGEHK